MLLEKVRQTVTQYNMLQKGDSVLVGVSGGPDSVALLYALNVLKGEFGLNLYVAHLNHMIRKISAGKDALFVKKTAEKLNLPAVIESKDVPKLAKDSRFSIEEAARNARYDFYLRTADRFKAKKIALGHTEDDQAETILMRLIRGSGLLGLSGIPPVRKFEETTIIRPLIDVSRKEIIKFLSRRKISYREDPTNTQPVYLRNKIRHRLLPFLEREFNPEAKRILNETAKNLRVDYAYLLKITEKKIKQYARYSKDKVRVSLSFLNENPAIQRMIIREAVRKVKGDLNSVTYVHWKDLSNLLSKKSPWSLNLPDKVLAKKVKNNIIFCKEGNKRKIDLTNILYQLKVPGKTDIPEIGKSLEAYFVKRPMNFKSSALPASPALPARGGRGGKKEEYFDFKKLKSPLYLRFKKSGDKIMPLGMTKYKRLKQLFIDEKIPPAKRDKIPLVFSGDNCVWVCGVKRSGYAKVSNRTKRTLKLKIVGLHNN